MKHTILSRNIITAVLLLLSPGELSWSQAATKLVPESTVKKELLKGHKISRDWEKLSIIRSIPAEDETRYSWGNPSDLAVAQSGELYVVDNYASAITVLDEDGDFLRTIGRAGQGPGEFDHPLRIEIAEKDVIYVSQGGRITKIDARGGFIDLFHLMLSIDDFKVMGGRLYANMIRRPGAPENSIIGVLDSRGKQIFSFGEPLRMPSLNLEDQAAVLSSDGVLLYVAFRHHPLIRVYDEHGAIVKEIRIKLKILDKIERLARDPAYTGLKYNPRAAPRLPRVIAAVSVHDDKIYVLLHLPRIEILCLDKNGNVVHHYYCNEVDDIVNYGYGLGVRRIGEATRFYLADSPRGKILILGTKNMKEVRAVTAD